MITWIVTSSALILVMIGVRYLIRGRISQRLQYALWGVVLLRLLIPVSLPSPWSVMSAAQQVPGLSRWLPETASQEAGAPVGSPVEGDKSQKEISSVGRPVNPGHGALRGIWMAGAALVGGWLLWANLRFAQKLRRERVAWEEPDCPLPVYMAAGLSSPCLFGLIRPAVYLTPQAAQTEETRRHVLAHEITHARHGDVLWAMLRGVCLALHWYNPLVWAAAFLSRRDGELACDEGATRSMETGERMSYGRSLICLAVGRPALTGIFCFATTMSGSKGELKERVLRIAKRPRTMGVVLMAALLIVAIAVAVTFTGAKEKQATLSYIPLTERERVMAQMSGLDGICLLQVSNMEAMPYFLMTFEEWRYGKNASVSVQSFNVGDTQTGYSGDVRYYIADKITRNDSVEWTGVEWSLVTVYGSGASSFHSPFPCALPKVSGGSMVGVYGQNAEKPAKLEPGKSYVLVARVFDLEGDGLWSLSCETLFDDDPDEQERLKSYGSLFLLRLTVYHSAEEVFQEIGRIDNLELDAGKETPNE